MSYRAHQHRMSVAWEIMRGIGDEHQFTWAENKSFMVRKINNMNLPLNSEVDK